MKFKLPHSGYLVLTESVCAGLALASGPGQETEVGGILLGRCFEEEIRVERISHPGPGDTASPTTFTRSAERAQAIIDDEWIASSGESIYLGEWHSHAESNPRPSYTDKEMIRTMRRETKMEIDFLLLVIVGWEDSWVGLHDGRTLKRLSPVREGRQKETGA